MTPKQPRERPVSRTEARRLEQRAQLADQRAEIAGDRQAQAERERHAAVSRAGLLQAEKDREWLPMLDAKLPRRLTIGAILAAVPSIAERFDVEVPGSALDGAGRLTCACGAVSEMRPNMLRECEGRCGRWFLRGERRVWRALGPPPPPDENEAPA